jgi:hypothetical protein
MLEKWCDAADRTPASTAQNDWPRAQFAALRTQVSDLIRPLYSELMQAIVDTDSVSLRADLHCLKNSITNLAGLLGLEEQIPERLADGLRGVQRCRDLRSTIAQRLVLYYELDLGADGEPTNLAEVEPGVFVVGTELRTPAQAVEGWIRREDYRFIPQILERTTDREGAGLRQRFESSLRNSRAQLTDRLSEVRGQIEKAYRDNIIDDNRRTESESGLFGIAPESALTFQLYYEKLKNVTANLDSARAEKAALLGESWGALQKRLSALPGADEFLSRIAVFIHTLPGTSGSLRKHYLSCARSWIRAGGWRTSLPPRRLNGTTCRNSWIRMTPLKHCWPIGHCDQGRPWMSAKVTLYEPGRSCDSRAPTLTRRFSTFRLSFGFSVFVSLGEPHSPF